MKGFLATALLFAATASAGLVPVSSAVCLTNAIVATECSATDNVCICTSDVFLSELAECAENTATTQEHAEQIVSIADAFCGATGADVKGDLKKRWGGQWTNWGSGKPAGFPFGGGKPSGGPFGGGKPPGGPWGRPGWGRPGSPPGWFRPGWGKPSPPSPVTPPPPVNTVW